MSAFRESLAGLVELPCYMDDSVASLGHRMAAVLREEIAKTNPDTHLIAVLCDAARVIDELLAMEKRYRTELLDAEIAKLERAAR